jgi:LysR family transcriptional regulator, transcriptional activator of nhaA
LFTVEWLNYHHLLYFWTVAREGSVARAADKLLLSQSTISGQIRSLERSLETKLFERVGRNLVLSEPGKLVYRYADEIFGLGRDLCATLAGQSETRLARVEIGVADVLPRWIVYQLLEPAIKMSETIQLVCYDDKTERLLSRLALNELDVVLTDMPTGPLIKVRAYSHLLGECGISFFGPTASAKKYKRGFPQSLDQAPFLLPMEGTALRRSLDEWFQAEKIRPLVRCEIGDCDLFEVFAHGGAGLFVAPTVLEERIRRQFSVEVVGQVETIHEKYFAITTERKIKNPAVVAIFESARRRFLK